MNIQDILNSRLQRESAINTKSYCDYIKQIYMDADSDITKTYPELYIIDSNNLETFWVDSGNDGTIVFDLHLLDFLHFFSMASLYAYSSKFDPQFTTIICCYIMANYYLTKGNVNASLFYMRKFNSELNRQKLVATLSDVDPKLNYEFQMMRGVQIHFILFHELAHIQFRKRKKDVGLLSGIMTAMYNFNDYTSKVNNYDITKIEHVLVKHKNLPPPIYIKNVLQEYNQLFNIDKLDANELHILRAVIENYYMGYKMDSIDENRNAGIIEECYCDLYAIKAIFDNFHFTSEYLSIDNTELIIKSIVCAITCINLINTVKSDPTLKAGGMDETLLKKELFRPNLVRLIVAYCAYGKWKRKPEALIEYYYDFSRCNELIYRFSIEFLLYNRDNHQMSRDIVLFSEEWYATKKHISQNLKLPFSHIN